MGKLFLKNLLKLDMVGPNYIFEIAGSSRFQSVQGAVLSGLSLCFCIAVAFLFGLDIFYKQNPIITSSTQTKIYSTISLYKYPIIFSLYNKKLENIVNFEEYLSFDVTEIIGPFTLDGGLDENIYFNSNKYNLFKCNITEEYEFYSASFYPNITLYCPDFTESTILQNQFVGSNSTTYRFNFYKCNPNSRKCADNINEIFETLDLYVAFVDSSVDPLDYYNPVKLAEKGRATNLSMRTAKRLNINLSLNFIYSDIGFIFEDIQVLSYIKVQSYELEYTFLENQNNYSQDIVSIILNSSQEIIRVTRSFIKIQEILAKVGGIANSLLIIINILFSDYLRFKYLNSVYSLIECEQDQLEIQPYFFTSKLKINTPSIEVQGKSISNADKNIAHSNNNIKLINIESRANPSFPSIHSLKENNKSQKSKEPIQLALDRSHERCQSTLYQFYNHKSVSYLYWLIGLIGLIKDDRVTKLSNNLKLAREAISFAPYLRSYIERATLKC